VPNLFFWEGVLLSRPPPHPNIFFCSLYLGRRGPCLRCFGLFPCLLPVQPESSGASPVRKGYDLVLEGFTCGFFFSFCYTRGGCFCFGASGVFLGTLASGGCWGRSPRFFLGFFFLRYIDGAHPQKRTQLLEVFAGPRKVFPPRIICSPLQVPSFLVPVCLVILHVLFSIPLSSFTPRAPDPFPTDFF